MQAAESALSEMPTLAELGRCVEPSCLLMADGLNNQVSSSAGCTDVKGIISGLRVVHFV